jgi:hypothetical protein
MEPLPPVTAIPKPANYDAAMAWCSQQGGTPLWAPPLENYEDQKSRKDWADQTGPSFADVQMTKVAPADEAKELVGAQMIANARAAAIAAWGNVRKLSYRRTSPIRVYLISIFPLVPYRWHGSKFNVCLLETTKTALLLGV